MAKPIKETPILTGNDAVRFEYDSINLIPVSEEEKEQAKQAFDYFSSIATFSL